MLENLETGKYGKYRAPVLVLLIAVCIIASLLLIAYQGTPGPGAGDGAPILFVPAIVAGLWYGRKSVLIALPLGAVMVLLSFLNGLPITPFTILDGILLLAAAFIAGVLSERKDRLNAGLADAVKQLSWQNESLRQTRAEFQRVNSELQRIIGFFPDAMMIVDAEGRVKAWNKAIEDMTGVPAADMIGKGDYEYAVPFYGTRRPILISLLGASDDELRRQYAEVTRKDGVIEATTSIPSLNGKPVVLQVRASALYDTDGRMMGAVESIRDVTEQKAIEAKLQQQYADLARREAQLRESEAKFRVLAETTPSIILIVQKGRVVYANPAAEKALGYGRGELEAISPSEILDMIAPEHRAFMRQKPVEEMERDRGTVRSEIRVRARSGEDRWIDATAGLLQYEDEVALLVTGFDVTARKQADEELKVLSKAVEESPSSVMIIDMHGTITYVNPRFTEISGYAAEEVIGKRNTMLAMDSRMPDNVREMLGIVASGRVWHGEFLYRKKSGEPYWVQASVAPIRGEKGKITSYVDVEEDITERKQADEQLRASLHEKEVLLKEIHPRVKNNLQIVSSMLNLQSMEVGDRRIADLFRESQARIRSMALIHEKLYQSSDLSRIDFGEYVQNLAAYLLRSYNGRGNTVKLNVDVGDIQLGIDKAVPCGLIINELVSNALKHAFPEGAFPEGHHGTIDIAMRREGKEYTLFVGDDGVGMPRQAEAENTGSIGLQLVDTLIEQIEGSISRGEERGTQFTIKFTDRK